MSHKYSEQIIKRDFELVQSKENLPVSQTKMQTKVYKRRSKMRGITVICPVDENVYSLDKHNGNYVEIFDAPMIERIKQVNYLSIVMFLNKVNKDKYFNITFERNETLVKSIIKILKVSKATGEKVSKDLINSQSLYKINTRHYIINPFLFKLNSISVYKHFEAQIRWEYFFFSNREDALPFYSYIEEDTMSQEEYDEGLKKIAKEISIKVQKDIVDVATIEFEEVSENFKKWIEADLEVFKSIVDKFIIYYHKESNSLKPDYASFVEYVSNDTNARHFVSWWNKRYEAKEFKVERKIPYRLRNKYCAYLTSIIKEGIEDGK